MVAILDSDEQVDLPGELEPENLISFPFGDEEPDPEPPATCPCCGGAVDAWKLVVAVCPECARRIPAVGGCGLGLVVVASFEASANRAFGHLLTCDDCAAWFDDLGHTAGVAGYEKDIATGRGSFPLPAAA